MRLGINTYTYMWSIGFEGAEPASPLTAMGMLGKARELGVRVVQIGPNLPLDRLPESELREFADCAKSWEIEIELATRGLELDHLGRQAALARCLGATLIRTIPEIDGRPAHASEVGGCLRQLLPLIDGEGLRLGIENGKIPAVDLARLIDSAESPRIGVVLDTTNSLAVPEGWRYVAEVLAPYVMCLHLKEFIIKRAWHMMGFICEGRPAGQGQLDIPWLLETCRRSPHDYNVIIELWPPEQKTLQETIRLEQAWAIESVRFMRQYVAD
jgi:sugar phosphate isomerase/epimerase